MKRIRQLEQGYSKQEDKQARDTNSSILLKRQKVTTGSAGLVGRNFEFNDFDYIYRDLFKRIVNFSLYSGSLLSLACTSKYYNDFISSYIIEELVSIRKEQSLINPFNHLDDFLRLDNLIPSVTFYICALKCINANRNACDNIYRICKEFKKRFEIHFEHYLNVNGGTLVPKSLQDAFSNFPELTFIANKFVESILSRKTIFRQFARFSADEQGDKILGFIEHAISYQVKRFKKINLNDFLINAAHEFATNNKTNPLRLVASITLKETINCYFDAEFFQIILGLFNEVLQNPNATWDDKLDVVSIVHFCIYPIYLEEEKPIPFEALSLIKSHFFSLLKEIENSGYEQRIELQTMIFDIFSNLASGENIFCETEWGELKVFAMNFVGEYLINAESKSLMRDTLNVLSYILDHKLCYLNKEELFEIKKAVITILGGIENVGLFGPIVKMLKAIAKTQSSILSKSEFDIIKKPLLNFEIKLDDDPTDELLYNSEDYALLLNFLIENKLITINALDFKTLRRNFFMHPKMDMGLDLPNNEGLIEDVPNDSDLVSLIIEEICENVIKYEAIILILIENVFLENDFNLLKEKLLTILKNELSSVAIRKQASKLLFHFEEINTRQCEGKEYILLTKESQ